jgi:peptide/nickel transport system permease protein
MIPVALGVVSLTFISVHLIPGDPVDALQSQGAHSSGLTKADSQRLRKSLGLDKPLASQYWDYVSHAAQLDLGRSIRTQQSVSSEIAARLPLTLKLAGLALGMSAFFGLVGGVLAAVFDRRAFGGTVSLLAIGGISVPEYWVGTMLALIFGVYIRWFPVSGIGGLSHLILPAASLAIINAALLTRLTRASLLTTLSADFIQTARAKGVREGLVVGKHALRVALVPVVTVIGLMVAGLLSGVVVIEKVFALPGVGSLAIDAVVERDFPVVQGTALFFAIVLMSVNLLVDLSYALLDPRIRYS